MNPKNAHAISLFLKYTNLEEHEALKTSNIDLGQYDFDRISQTEVTEREWILFEIVRFLATNDSLVLLQDLTKLDKTDLSAFVYALSEIVGLNRMNETL